MEDIIVGGHGESECLLVVAFALAQKFEDDVGQLGLLLAVVDGDVLE